MEMLFSFVAGLVLAGIVAIFVLRSVKSAAIAAQTKALDDADKQAEANQRAAVAKLEADLKNAQDIVAQVKQDADKHTQELLEAKEQAHQQAFDALEKRHAEAVEAERKRNEAALAAMKDQVQNVTNQMLKERQAELQQSNSENLKQVVDPLTAKLAEMETALKENRSIQETSTTTIKENIATLVSTTLHMQDSADRLSNALTAESKTQGNWGEQKLENLLNAMGLERGLEYDAQEFLRDANGEIIVSDETDHRMQPDIILHLDETRDLIVDSKVSLNAFVDYTNAETEEQRNIALAAHLRSVRNHVKELARKNYSAYVKAPRQSVDFVMMFVPVDAALQLALDSDPTLWRDATDQGVFIVGSQNLYAALRTVHATWATIKQNQNNKAICDTAAELITRVGDLLEKVRKMGTKLNDVNVAYGEVVKKAKTGQSVLGSANKLVKLGTKVSTVHPLPAEEEEDILPQLPAVES